MLLNVHVIEKAHLSDNGVTNISKSFTHKMAAKTRWHRDMERNYATVTACIKRVKSMSCFFDSRCIMLYAVAPTRHQLGSQYYFSASFIHREFLPVQSVAPRTRSLSGYVHCSRLSNLRSKERRTTKKTTVGNVA